MSNKQIAYILLTIYKEYANVSYEEGSSIWQELSHMSYDDLVSKLEEDAFLAINLFPDLKQRILEVCGLEEDELEEE